MHVVVGGTCSRLALGDHGVLEVLGLFFGLFQQAHAALTQLGGLAIGDGAGGLAYEWKDPGICAVCNFEDALDALDGKTV